MTSDESGLNRARAQRHLLNRRTTLRGAAAAATLAWVAPAVQVVTMSTAHAASAPPPEVRPPERPPAERPPVDRPVEHPPVEAPVEAPVSETPVSETPDVGAVVEQPPATPSRSRSSVPARSAAPENAGVAAASPQVRLARTGTSPWGAVGVGTATVATGAAAIAAAHRLKQRPQAAAGTSAGTTPDDVGETSAEEAP